MDSHSTKKVVEDAVAGGGIPASVRKEFEGAPYKKHHLGVYTIDAKFVIFRTPLRGLVWGP